jgi:Cof subfamily protein (haloacid dehalogenase superfamily)
VSGAPIRLLLSDIDGTLITHDKVLTESTVAAVQRLHDAAVGFTLTSSRPPPGLGMFVESLGLTLPLAAFNGGVYCDVALRPLEQHPIPEAVVGPMVERIRSSGLDVWVYRAGEWLVRSATGPHVEHESGVVQFTPTVVPDFDDLIAGRNVSDVAKIVGVSDDLPLVAELEREVSAEFGDRVSASRSQVYYLDVTHPNANKGAVVDFLVARLGIPAESIATIGDGPNDTLMFARSGTSIAMGNGAPEVQDAATHVTGANDDDGFARAIDEFILG